MAPKRKSTPSQNPLRFGASTSFDPTPFSVQFRDEMDKTDFFENFSRRDVHSEHQVIFSDFSDTNLPTIMHGFDYSVPLFVTRVRGTCIVVTPDIVFNVLRVPRVEHPNYPGCDHLRAVFKDELISSFCERPSDWGDHQFTSCTAFAKGPRFLNMVMTFLLHPLSHYNSITEPVLGFGTKCELSSLFLHR